MASNSKIFDLSLKSLKLDDASSLESHIGPLKEKTDFKEIRLNGNTLGVAASETLAPLISAQQSLEVANLGDIFTGRLLSEIPKAISFLLQALAKCPKLHTIDLSDNAFGLNTVGPLVSFIEAAVPLQHLILNNNGMGPAAGTQLAEALQRLAKKKSEARRSGQENIPELETIVCGRNRLEAGSMKAWAAAFQALKHIQTVRMTQNGIRPQGIIALLTGLVTCSDLKVLDLQDNTFTAPGSAALAAALPKWSALLELGVGDCLLSARGGVLLGDALAKGGNAKLQLLKASYNEIDASGLKELVKALDGGHLEGLHRIELNGNKFPEDEEGVDKLRTVLGERRDKAGADEDDECWGVDELDDMEEDTDDEDEDQAGGEDNDEDDDDDDKPAASGKEKDVDDLADSLGKTHV